MSSQETSGKAIASFVCGLLTLTTFCLVPVFPILAIVLGAGEEEGLGRAGMIMGWIAVVLYAVCAAALLLFWLVGGIAAVAG